MSAPALMLESNSGALVLVHPFIYRAEPERIILFCQDGHVPGLSSIFLAQFFQLFPRETSKRHFWTRSFHPSRVEFPIAIRARLRLDSLLTDGI
jgi:hypothetical protein